MPQNKLYHYLTDNSLVNIHTMGDQHPRISIVSLHESEIGYRIISKWLIVLFEQYLIANITKCVAKF